MSSPCHVLGVSPHGGLRAEKKMSDCRSGLSCAGCGGPCCGAAHMLIERNRAGLRRAAGPGRAGWWETEERQHRRYRNAHQGERLHRADPPRSSTWARFEANARPDIFTSIGQLPSLQKWSGTATNIFTPSSGQQGLSSHWLRGLGPIRPLTLPDGQRVVGANVTRVPDISLLPQLPVQRVDVVNGGASASCGSDAVGGAVKTPASRSIPRSSVSTATAR